MSVFYDVGSFNSQLCALRYHKSDKRSLTGIRLSEGLSRKYLLHTIRNFQCYQIHQVRIIKKVSALEEKIQIHYIRRGEGGAKD